MTGFSFNVRIEKTVDNNDGSLDQYCKKTAKVENGPTLLENGIIFISSLIIYLLTSCSIRQA